MSEIGTYLLAATIGGLISAVVFASLWVCWLRHMQTQLKRIQRLMYDRPIQPVTKPALDNAAAAVFAANITKKPELVAQFKVKDGQHTVSVMESDGKRFLRVDGDLSWKQRLKMLRYLKAEGFMD